MSQRWFSPDTTVWRLVKEKSFHWSLTVVPGCPRLFHGTPDVNDTTSRTRNLRSSRNRLPVGGTRMWAEMVDRVIHGVPFNVCSGESQNLGSNRCTPWVRRYLKFTSLRSFRGSCHGRWFLISLLKNRVRRRIGPYFSRCPYVFGVCFWYVGLVHMFLTKTDKQRRQQKHRFT